MDNTLPDHNTRQPPDSGTDQPPRPSTGKPVTTRPVSIRALPQGARPERRPTRPRALEKSQHARSHRCDDRDGNSVCFRAVTRCQRRLENDGRSNVGHRVPPEHPDRREYRIALRATSRDNHHAAYCSRSGHCSGALTRNLNFYRRPQLHEPSFCVGIASYRELHIPRRCLAYESIQMVLRSSIWVVACR